MHEEFFNADIEDNSQAELVRVNPKEFAAALKAIDGRRYAESSFIANTVPIGEAIRELDVDVSASEVLREVLALRREGWVCSNCGERIEPDFDDCWRCGTSRFGSPPGNPLMYEAQIVDESVPLDQPEASQYSEIRGDAFEVPCPFCGETSWLVGRLNRATFSSRSVGLNDLPIMCRACARCGFIALFLS